MSKEAYGKNTKKIVFLDTDHRHANLIVRLRHDGLTQSDFFRSLITGYIEGDTRIQDYVDEVSPHSKLKKKHSRKLRLTGQKQVGDMGLSDQQVENIFDLLEEERSDL